MQPTIDPIRFDAGYIQLLPDGGCIIALDPLPADAAPDVRAYHARYVAALDLMGHRVVTGGWDGLCAALAEETTP